MENTLSHILLAVLWIAWCVLHSALINPSISRLFQKRFPNCRRYYRIFYNLFTVVSLLPVLWFTFSLRGELLFIWEGPWRVIPILLGCVALFFFAAGALRYDFLQFLGFRQVHDETACGALTTDCSLDTGGILSVVRHPWYVCGILTLWVRSLDPAALLTNLIVSSYFVVGAFLEERRLKAHFGPQFVDYQQRVSMFIPIKWVKQRLFGKSRPL